MSVALCGHTAEQKFPSSHRAVLDRWMAENHRKRPCPPGTNSSVQHVEAEKGRPPSSPAHTQAAGISVGHVSERKEPALGLKEPEGHCPLANQERAPTWGLWGDRDSLEHPHLNVTVLERKGVRCMQQKHMQRGQKEMEGQGTGHAGRVLGTPGEGGLLLGASLPLSPSIPFALHPTLPFSHHLTVWQDLPIRAPASGQHRPIPGSKPGPHDAWLTELPNKREWEMGPACGPVHATGEGLGGGESGWGSSVTVVT